MKLAHKSPMIPPGLTHQKNEPRRPHPPRRQVGIHRQHQQPGHQLCLGANSCAPLDAALCSAWQARQVHQQLGGPVARLGMGHAREQHPDVSAPGYINDLGEAGPNAAFTIAPIYSGGGTNIKILESLVYGRASPRTTRAFPVYALPGWPILATEAARQRGSEAARQKNSMLN
jgi:hypothetical protein